MIINFEDKMGNDIGQLWIIENNIDGQIEIKDVEGNISIADIDVDTYFETNEPMIRVQMVE